MSDKEETQKKFADLLDSIENSNVKTKTSGVGCGVTLILSAILFALGFGVNLFFALTLWLYYGWFIEPVTAFKIPFYTILGVGMVIGMIQGRAMMAQQQNIKEVKTAEENLATGFGLVIAQVILYSMMIFFGWLYYLIFV